MNKEKLFKVKEQMLQDIEKLVAIASLPDENSKTDNAPFGKNIRTCFDVFKEIAEDKGFCVEDDQGYAMSASIGEQEEYIGVLGHLDVVEAGEEALWDTHPFQMVEKDGVLYGRGVNDDKGPLIAALYAAWLIKEEQLPLRYAIRIIAGGAEETTWECMEHYFQSHKQPVYGFSPDGNFPIVNGEKGILQIRFTFPITEDIEIHARERYNYVCDELQVKYQGDTKTYKGKRALSRNPQRGENAIFAFAHDYKTQQMNSGAQSCMDMIHDVFLDDFYGEKSGLYSEDTEMGTTSVCPMSLTCDDSLFELCVDVRYVKSTSYEKIWERLQEIASTYGATLECIKHKRLLFVEEDSPLIRGLKNAYERVMHEEVEVLTKGGASYARVLDRGIAFGATFPDEDPKPHMPNECMPIDSLLKACEIYYEALCELALK
ncbi:Sapep family Mn(2+)-dependent dipeptidase [Amedibacillus sp. YH-ame10]